MKKTVKKKTIVLVCIAIIAILIALNYIGPEVKKKRAPIKIGFVGSLTGRNSENSVAGRNGAVLAVEQVNASGGINGRPVELIIKDDRLDQRTAQQAVQELINAGVSAIIGHMTSSMAMATLPMINEAKITTISPTASTDKLSGLDDYLLRMTVSTKLPATEQGRYLFHDLGIKKAAVIYDLSNPDYTRNYYEIFKSAYETAGGRIVHTATFTSGKPTAYPELIWNILNSNPEGLLTIASSLETALICQHLSIAHSKMQVFATGWAFSPELLQHGGASVENVILLVSYNKDNKDKRFLEFKEQFRKRFDQVPNYAATYSYEAAQVLVFALNKTDESEKLKGVILEQRSFKGIPEDITFDTYGDPRRKLLILKVINRHFTAIQ
jgi:branched-chain amino acid transport system substrate-binding protein